MRDSHARAISRTLKTSCSVASRTAEAGTETKPFSRERLDEALDVAFFRTAGERLVRPAELLKGIQNLGSRPAPRIAVGNSRSPAPTRRT